MIDRPAYRKPLKAKIAKIELVNKIIDHPNRIVLADPLIQPFGEVKAKLVANDASVPVRDRLSRQAAENMVTSWFEEQFLRVGSRHDDKLGQSFATGCTDRLDESGEDFEKSELAADVARFQMRTDPAGTLQLVSIIDGILRTNGYPLWRIRLVILSWRLHYRGAQKTAAILPIFHVQDMPRTDGGV